MLCPTSYFNSVALLWYIRALVYAFCLVWEVDSVLARNKTSAAAAFGTATSNTKSVNLPTAESNYIALGGNDDDGAVEYEEIDLLDDEMSIFFPY